MSNTVRPIATKHTVVEDGSTFKGTLTSSCPIHVHGRVEGDLEAPSLMVSGSGAVHGRVKVAEVRSQGELSGEFDADSIEIAGSVKDNTVIRARSLEVKLASTRGKIQVIFGECELSVGDAPSESDAVEPVAAGAEVVLLPEAAPAVEAPAAAALESASAAPPAEPAPPPEAVPFMEAAPPAPAGAVAAAVDAAATSEHADEESGDEAEAEAAAEGGGAGKRRRKRKQTEEDARRTGWSEHPSQPPPAN
jgi:cytoskeletal protein CcmA (bactofilin family)